MSEPGMSPNPRAAEEHYSSTVVAPGQIALGVGSGVVAAVILLAFGAGLRPFAALALVLAIAVSVYLGVVRLRVEPGRVTIGQGRGEREQRIVYTSELISAQAQRLSWRQCAGIGMPEATRTTRLSVKAGDALVLITREDELIAVSTPDARRALEVLTSGAAIPAPAPPPVPVRPHTTNPRPRPRPRTDDAG